ncbi:hypothetical protein T310_9925, partial [Rasamsonia emersonii CBS 393.64]
INIVSTIQREGHSIFSSARISSLFWNRLFPCPLRCLSFLRPFLSTHWWPFSEGERFSKYKPLPPVAFPSLTHLPVGRLCLCLTTGGLLLCTLLFWVAFFFCLSFLDFLPLWEGVFRGFSAAWAF